MDDLNTSILGTLKSISDRQLDLQQTIQHVEKQCQSMQVDMAVFKERQQIIEKLQDRLENNEQETRKIARVTEDNYKWIAEEIKRREDNKDDTRAFKVGILTQIVGTLAIALVASFLPFLFWWITHHSPVELKDQSGVDPVEITN